MRVVWISVAFLFTLNIVSGVYQEDRVVIVNDTTTLTCEKFPSVVWKFKVNPSTHSSDAQTVYSSENIKETFNGSFFIVNTTIEITRTKLGHAGVYECFRDFGDTEEVQLTVLENVPECYQIHNASIDGQIQLRCSLSFKGNCYPTLSWLTPNGATHIADVMNITENKQSPSKFISTLNWTDTGVSVTAEIVFRCPRINSSEESVHVYNWTWTMNHTHDRGQTHGSSTVVTDLLSGFWLVCVIIAVVVCVCLCSTVIILIWYRKAKRRLLTNIQQSHSFLYVSDLELSGESRTKPGATKNGSPIGSKEQKIGKKHTRSVSKTTRPKQGDPTPLPKNVGLDGTVYESTHSLDGIQNVRVEKTTPQTAPDLLYAPVDHTMKIPSCPPPRTKLSERNK